jgi:purine-cytosine permease-like protein
MASQKGKSVVETLDALNEFDREPVPENKLHGTANFIGLFSGEHIAGTEYVIGPLFVAHGVRAIDLFLGLLAGNLLAVCSWAFLTTPIAVRTRLNLYWHLRKIAGPYVTFLYNSVNALMFCFLAGAMISVSATAIGIPFGLQMPTLQDRFPTSVEWVLTVLAIGLVVTVFAIYGFEKISHFGKVASPWMAPVFAAAAIAVLPSLGVHSPGDFWRVANERIWTGVPMAGQSKFTFWHVMFFAWFCNMAMHIGMADLSIMRFAKKWTVGFTSAFGMFLGHYMAWIASGILCAAALGNVAPGPIAVLGAGLAGAVSVVVAGWTTANPTLYRAGLALQVVTPDWKRWRVTLVAGIVTTVAAVFPAFIMKLLDFVALYGLVLMPIGAVIFTDFWLFPKFGLERNYSEKHGILLGWPVLLAWFGALALVFALDVEIFFKGLPGWFLTVVLYSAFGFIQQKRAALSQGGAK